MGDLRRFVRKTKKYKKNSIEEKWRTKEDSRRTWKTGIRRKI